MIFALIMDESDSESSYNSNDESDLSESEVSEVWSDSNDTWSHSDGVSDDETDFEDDTDETESETSSRSSNLFEEVLEYDLIPTSAPSLEEMACVTAALALWKRARNFKKEFEFFASEISKWTSQLPIPKPLSTLIEDRFNEIKISESYWAAYNSRKIFFNLESTSKFHRLADHIIWYPNGIINFKETARNLLNSDTLTNVQKYRIACTYCLQEDIERIWPSMDKDSIIDENRFTRHPLIYYWNCYCSNDLDKMIPLLGDTHIDEFMFRNHRVDNWPAKEYFFDRLSVEEQVLNANWSIEEDGIDYQKLLLTKLNESQRLHVYMDKFAVIISNYLCADLNEENAISAWYYIRELITQEQFKTLCKAIISTRHDNYVFVEIWSSAPAEYKRHVLMRKNYRFFTEVFDLCCARLEDNLQNVNIDFVSTVLLDDTCSSLKREITNENFFFEVCEIFILSHEGVEMLDRLLNICLPEAEECAKFKRSFVKIAKKNSFSKRCEELLIDGDIKKLVRLLTFCLSETDPKSMQIARDILRNNLKHLDDRCLAYYSTGSLKELNDFLAPLSSTYPKIILEYKTKLLLSENGIQTCISHFSTSIVALAAIVADGLPLNSELAAQFKRDIIFSHESIDKLQSFIQGGHLNNVKKFVGWFLKSNRDKKKLKSRLVDRLKHNMKRIDTRTRKKFSEFL